MNTIFFYRSDNEAAKSLAYKLAARGSQPGAIIPLTEDEMKALADPKIFQMITISLGKKYAAQENDKSRVGQEV